MGTGDPSDITLESHHEFAGARGHQFCSVVSWNSKKKCHLVDFELYTYVFVSDEFIKKIYNVIGALFNLFFQNGYQFVYQIVQL